jgi:hypothetical protein
LPLLAEINAIHSRRDTGCVVVVCASAEMVVLQSASSDWHCQIAVSKIDESQR